VIIGNAFVEMAIILGFATLFGIAGQKLRQPLVIMFLATGILAGPAGFGIIQSHEQIELLAQIGIALLLFIVGLKLDLKLIRTTGPVALATGLGQILFTSVFGFLIAIAMHMSYLSAAYVAVSLTFSSTIIVVKLLSDKKEIDSLHGQIALGFLIVQDIAAILALVALTSFGAAAAESGSSLLLTVYIIGKGLGILLFVMIMMKYVIPLLTQRLAHSLELLTLFAIAWAVLLGAGSELLGFSKEVGAFLAGVSLASSEFKDSIGARLTSLRDFLLLFFFIDLGARLDWTTVGAQLGKSTIFSLFVLVGNPLIVILIMGFMGYRRRTGFMAGLTVAQISEFSLILAALGLSMGHITNETVGLITLVGVVTIFLSTYMILYSAKLYSLLSPMLRVFERKNPYRESAINTLKMSEALDVILVGLGNYGQGLAEYLIRRNKTLSGIDFDPNVLKKWREKGIPVIYGDMTDPEIYPQLPCATTRWIVSTVRSKEMSLVFLGNLKANGYTGKIALTATNDEEANEYIQAGAHLVFRPFADATEQAADALTYAMDFLPENINWPISFLDVRIRTDSSAAGKVIRDIPLRTATGVSILAISRAGHVHFDPEPDFRVFPGDRLLIMGPAVGLKDAEYVINAPEMSEDIKTGDHFEHAEIALSDNSSLSGKTIADIRVRQMFGVTLAGIRRGDIQITTINPSEKLLAGDRLIVIGTAEAVKRLKRKEPL